MARYSAADAGRWANVTNERLDLVVKQAANDLMVRASKTAPSTIRGGSIQPGFVPRDTGFLAASLVSSLQGGAPVEGTDSWRFVVAGMEAGDLAVFGWSAKYARVQHYKGWLWRDMAANDWQRIVREAAARIALGSGA
jgi:hypothetical protein